MSLVIAHLSDIHFRYATDRVLARAHDIATAIVAATGTSTEILIITTGDIAWSGTKEEYELAAAFYESINATLLAQRRDGTFAFVPGNHDCDFSGGDTVRAMLLEGIRNQPHQARDAELQKHFLQVQASFVQFVSDLGQRIKCVPFGTSVVTRSAYGDVSLQLLNSAWMSSMHEGTGTLVFPDVEVSRDLTIFTITCLHHPPHWFTQSCRRELWRAIAQGSDLVLTGHEHEAAQATIDSKTDATLHSHFEGGALQAHGDTAESIFSVYSIDIPNRSCATYRYRWSDKERQYVYATDSGATRPKDEPLPLNRVRSLRQFEFSEKHREFLCSLTMNITHPVVGTLRLPDIFTHPDLGASKLSAEATGVVDSTVLGKDLIGLIEREPMLLVTGDKYAGRTALAKTLCSELHMRGFVPVLVRPTKKVRTSEGWIELIERAFGEQYAASLVAKFQQLPVVGRAVLIDDVDLAVGDVDSFVPALQGLKSYAGHVILLSETSALDARIQIRLAQTGIPNYQIRPFGYRQRDKLIQKWILLGGDQIDGPAVVRKLHETNRTINAIVGKGFVPSYPFFVLAILHAADSAVQLEARTSAHGYYIEQLIRTELLKGRQEHTKLDVTLGALSFIAYRFFSDGVDKMSDRDLRTVIERYESEYALQLDYGRLTEHLIERRMMCRTESSFSFIYDYVYYFFVARYLSRNIDKDEVRKLVRKLCRATDRRKNGDVLLFLAHFSNDPFVITQMIEGANEAFKEERPVDLRKDLSVLTDLNQTIDRMIYEDSGDAAGARARILDQKDRTPNIERTADFEDDDEFEHVNALLAAIRNMEVVGQVLKNNPGHLDATRKLEIAKAAYSVGARIWRWFLTLLATEQKGLVEDLLREAKLADPNASVEELRTDVERTLLGLVRLVSLSMVKRIAMSIGAPELQATYTRLVEVFEGDASQLVSLSIMLDTVPGLPEAEVRNAYVAMNKNPLAVWVVRQLVLEHLHLFQLDSKQKQRLCAAAEIEYKSGLGSGQRNKLLPK